jgi:hypothetical protein
MAFKVLVVLNVGLAIVHLMTQFGDSLLHPGLVRIFNVDVENSVPTWVSSVQLLAAAILLTVIGFCRMSQESFRGRQWLGLALIFVAMSMDEVIQLHESSEKIAGADILGMDWIVPGFLLTCLVALSYIHFFLSLSRNSQILFFIAAACFIGGALGFEIVGFWMDDQTSLDRILTVSVEEFLERIGISVFIFGLLRYIRDELPSAEPSATVIRAAPAPTAVPLQAPVR